MLLFLFLFSTSAFSHNILYPVSDDMVLNSMQSEQMSVLRERNSFRNVSLIEAAEEQYRKDARLSKAIRNEDVKAVQKSLAEGADLDARAWEKPALVFAIEVGNLKIVELILEAGAKAVHHDAVGLYGGSPLEAAIEKGNPEILDKILKAGGGRGNTNMFIMGSALHPDLEHFNLEVIRVLISNKITSFGIEGSNSSVRSSELISMAMSRGPEAAEMLIEASDTFINTIILDHGEELLNRAARIGNLKIMKLILDNIALNPEIKSKFQNFKFNKGYPFSNPLVNGALIHAVRLNNPKTVKLLLDRGADPTGIIVEGKPLRYYAQKRKLTEIVEILDANSSASCSAAFGGSK